MKVLSLSADKLPIHCPVTQVLPPTEIQLSLD